MNLEGDIPAPIESWLVRAIRECRRRIRAVDFQLRVDRGYVDSPEAEPGEIDFYRCQIALNVIEREGLEKKLALLEEWSLEAGGRGALPRAGPRQARG